MKMFALASSAFVLALGLAMSPVQAAPTGGVLDSLKQSTPQSLVEQVYCRRYHVCKGHGYNRRCYWVQRCH
ncbi:MAG: hypothetical protein ACKVP7_26020 [Hyphomicrobiaceae bacterium]